MRIQFARMRTSAAVDRRGGKGDWTACGRKWIDARPKAVGRQRKRTGARSGSADGDRNGTGWIAKVPGQRTEPSPQVRGQAAADPETADRGRPPSGAEAPVVA